jgi:hypothetical protein
MKKSLELLRRMCPCTSFPRPFMFAPLSKMSSTAVRTESHSSFAVWFWTRITSLKPSVSCSASVFTITYRSISGKWSWGIFNRFRSITSLFRNFRARNSSERGRMTLVFGKSKSLLIICNVRLPGNNCCLKDMKN